MNEKVCDIVGLLYHSNIFELFYPEESKREKTSWKELMKELESSKWDKVEIEDLIADYGVAREETGFRIGFSLAMQLFLNGYNVNWL